MRFPKVLCLSFLFCGACALTSNRTEVVKKKDAVSAPGAAGAVAPNKDIVSTIEFEPGRKALSPEATAELNRAITEARRQGQVVDVNVAAWSDAEATAGEGPRATPEQVELAQARAENIERYLDRVEPEAPVTVHNMAKQPATLTQFLNTKDAQVKDRLAQVGVTADENTAQVKGRSSSALVFIKLK